MNTVFEPKIANVDVARLGASGGTAIGSETNGAFVVLFKDVTSNGVPLGFHKMLDPNGVGHVIASSDRFGFSGAFGIDFLFSRFAEDGAAAERDGTTGVAAAIGVDGVRSVDPCAEAAKVISADSVGIIKRPGDVFEEAAEFAKVLLRGLSNTGGEKTGSKKQIHAAPEGDIKEFGHYAVKHFSRGSGEAGRRRVDGEKVVGGRCRGRCSNGEAGFSDGLSEIVTRMEMEAVRERRS